MSVLMPVAETLKSLKSFKRKQTDIQGKGITPR
jgi:hypothetical protein